jgi:hypothetical protein
MSKSKTWPPIFPSPPMTVLIIRITVRGVIMAEVIVITTVIVWICIIIGVWVSVVIGVRVWVIISLRIRLPLKL